jgi:hypothetical protein
MTTARTFSEFEGTLSAPEPSERKCGRCKEPMQHQLWTSRDEGYEDSKFTCPAGHVEWVDGLDS